MMKRFIFVIPLLFLGIQPYTQINEKTGEEKEPVLKVEEDTLFLSLNSDKLIEETKELEKLEQKEKELKRQLSIIERKRRLKDKRELEQIKKDLQKFDERGL